MYPRFFVATSQWTTVATASQSSIGEPVEPRPVSIERYRLEISEMDDHAGLSADVYGDDELVEATANVSYQEYGLEPTADGTEPVAAAREVTADVTTTDLQIGRDGGGFSFRLVGDRDELLSIRIEDAELGLGSG